MTLVPTSGPDGEPVSLAEVKAHLRVTGSTEDIFLLSLITAARVHIETLLGRALLTQGWSMFLDRWPRSSVLELPLAPVASIAAIRVLAAGGSVVTLATEHYMLDGRAAPPRLVTVTGRPWSSIAPAPAHAANGIEIDLVAGYGAAPSAVPAPVLQAIRLLVTHWFERREPIAIGPGGEELPAMIREIIAPYRLVRP